MQTIADTCGGDYWGCVVTTGGVSVRGQYYPGVWRVLVVCGWVIRGSGGVWGVWWVMAGVWGTGDAHWGPLWGVLRVNG